MPASEAPETWQPSISTPFAFDRIDAIGSVVRLGPAGPGDADAVIDDVVGALGLDPVTLGVFDREIAQRHLVAGDQQSLARALLSAEVEHGRIHPRARHRHPVGVEAEPIGEREAPRAELNGVARLGEDQRLLQLVGCAVARIDMMRGCDGWRAADASSAAVKAMRIM